VDAKIKEKIQKNKKEERKMEKRGKFKLEYLHRHKSLSILIERIIHLTDAIQRGICLPFFCFRQKELLLLYFHWTKPLRQPMRSPCNGNAIVYSAVSFIHP
jgi:hypothetical protein